jgi:hypothetical protein
MSRAQVLSATAIISALALIYTYPLATAPTKANRFDSPDALLNAWTLSWDLHQLGRDPLHLFDANIFFPDKGTLAYSENLVTAAIMIMPFRLVSDDPVLLLNLAFVGALITSGLAAFILGRHLTGSFLSGILAGILFAFAPYRWAHVPHLQLQLAFALPLSFYFVKRLENDARTPAAIGLAVTIAAAFGSSGYYAIFLITALPLGIAAGWARSEMKRRMLKQLAVAGILTCILAAPLIFPYATKLQRGSGRTFAVTHEYSAGPREYLSSFSRLHFFLPKAEEPLFPGAVAAVLALVALVSSSRQTEKQKPTKVTPSRLPEVWTYAAVGLLGVVLSLGPSGGFFTLLFRFVPPYQGLRVPSRAAILFLLAVAILSAYGLAKVKSRWFRILLVTVASLECFAGPIPWSFELPAQPPIYRHVAALPDKAAIVELPLPQPDSFQDNARYVYRSIEHWQPMVNGYSGFVPASYRRAFRLLMRQELDAGLRTLSEEGLQFVLVHSRRIGPRMRRQIAAAERSGLLILQAQEGEDRLYEIRTN